LNVHSSLKPPFRDARDRPSKVPHPRRSHLLQHSVISETCLTLEEHLSCPTSIINVSNERLLSPNQNPDNCSRSQSQVTWSRLIIAGPIPIPKETISTLLKKKTIFFPNESTPRALWRGASPVYSNSNKYLHPRNFAEEGCCFQSSTFTIPSPKPFRRPANIPLRTLSTPVSRSNSQSPALLSNREKRRSSLSRSSSPPSEFSWSDTGDLAEQLADEDPLHSRIEASLESQGLVAASRSRGQSRSKKVRYREHSESRGEKSYQPGLVKEDIEIPEPAQRKVSRAEHIIASIMSGGERQMHGLTGKPLV
jgi:hypothetical protein